MLTHVEVEDHAGLDTGLRHRRGEGAGRVGVVDEGGEGCLGILADEFDEPAEVGADEGVGDEHVRCADRREHLGLGDGGALVPGHARLEQHPGDLARLVRFDVRAQS